MVRRRLAGVGIAFVLVASLMSGAPAAAQGIPDDPTEWAGVIAFGGPGSFAAGWTTPRVVVPQGVGVTLMVVDAQPHNFVAFGEYGPDDNFWCALMNSSPGFCPLFWSELIFGPQAVNRPGSRGLGEVFTVVHGLEDLEPRDYKFYCSAHSAFMVGTLTIV